VLLGGGFRMPLEFSMCGGMLYSLILLKKYLDFRIHKEEMDSIDLDRLLLSNDDPLKKEGVSELIGNYVEDCFNRDVLFFNVFKDDDYIDESTEKRLLSELCDSAAANMSRTMRDKLALYYGRDNLDIIIGRKCFATITMFVAKHNHKIYDGTR
jgi:hypothetical protein